MAEALAEAKTGERAAEDGRAKALLQVAVTQAFACFAAGATAKACGNPKINLKRNVPLACFGALAAIPGVRLISLMKVPAPESVAAFAVESLGADFDAGPDAFIDSAAVMANCDLVVTSDTSIAHLAGALGRPVFLALRYAPDWRWLASGTHSPWYPTMRLFRQTERGDWAPVFEAIVAAVRARIGLAAAEPLHETA